MKLIERVNLVFAALIIISIAATACESKVFEMEHQPFPEMGEVDNIPINVGVEKAKTELKMVGAQGRGSYSSTATVPELLADRLNEEKIVNIAVYPYTKIAGPVDVIFKTEENVVVDMNMDENMGKAFLVGFTFFLLAPALPFNFDIHVKADLKAVTPSGQVIKEYSSGTKYRYTWYFLSPMEEDLDQWSVVAFKHVAEDLAKQIAQDRELLLIK